ncbi:AraC family transcriptional regulator [Texcoconibacillus texcoconensis]|uniref:YesN/AraC family two-component response regulator n=1 Tax=Texcoconibacillus texcoconensis TaxID=1095777 RepID=A0A840QSK6_9BACI|nr:AraC family transcriptional regulator [Texcoconibacillus texcoconensis]MBB5174344.1 YesN/AraC family two-component response regulator [Texcoconibacillus texcoconensis]
MTVLCFQVPPYPTYIKSGKATFPKGHQHFKRTFHVFDLLFVEKGTLYMKEDDEAFSVGAGEYMLLLPNKEHVGLRPCDEDTTFYWLHFEVEGEFIDKWLEGDIAWADVLKQTGTFTEPARFQLHLSRYGKVMNKETFTDEFERLIQLNESYSSIDKMKQQAIFTDIIVHWQNHSVRLPTSAEKVTEEALNVIHNLYSDPTLSVAHLSKTLLYHSDYITRCMKRTLGMTPVQYIHQYRIQKAKSMLKEGNTSVQAIAKSVGFEDRAYFSRVFRKVEGISPRDYRTMGIRR